MSPGPIFDRVYAGLKQLLLAGRWAPGTHLEPGALADDLSASITPVRDALHRLLGERLIEAPRHDGFWVPQISEAQLRELYDWNGELLSLSLRRRGTPWPGGDMPSQAFDEAAALFEVIAQAAQNPEIENAVASTNDRLAPFRTAEARVFDDTAGELASLALGFRESDAAGLRRALAVYHRRRQRAAPMILAELRRQAEPPRRP